MTPCGVRGGQPQAASTPPQVHPVLYSFVYSHVLHNDVSVSDRPHRAWWSHEIIMESKHCSHLVMTELLGVAPVAVPEPSCRRAGRSSHLHHLVGSWLGLVHSLGNCFKWLCVYWHLTFLWNIVKTASVKHLSIRENLFIEGREVQLTNGRARCLFGLQVALLFL